MKLFRLLVLSLTLAACGGGEGDGPTPDSPTGGGTCAIYDSCTALSECGEDAVECHFFMQDGFQVCTPACTPNDNSTCPPDSSGAPGECNNRGICKPAAVNPTSACTP